MQDRLLIGANS